MSVFDTQSWEYHNEQSHSLLDFIKNILICVLKMNKGLMGLEQHEGE